MLSIASFAIAAIGLVVAITSFLVDKDIHPRVRVTLGVPFLLLAILFGLLGFFSVLGDNSSAVIPSPSSQSTEVIFSENFESGRNDSFVVEGGGNWSVADDGTGNHVLNADSTKASWSYSRFSSNTFSDGVIEYRVRVITVDPSADSNSGDAFLIFRDSSAGRYQFVVNPQSKSAAIFFQDNNDGPWVLLEQGQNDYKYNFQKGVWYSIRMEVRVNVIKVFIDGNPILSVQDSQLADGRLSLAIGPSTVAQFDNVSVSLFAP